jgi:S-adenosyl methyltransferase
MTDSWSRAATRRAKAAMIDTTTPNAARVGDYLEGGKDNFEADRRAVRTLVAVAPVTAAIPPALRAFHQRALHYLIAEAGVRQFLETNTGLATTGSTTHQVAQSLAPECRVVYADDDPMVLAHLRALEASAPQFAVASVDADLSDPVAILSGAAEVLDFRRPVAILLNASLPYVLDDAAAAEIMLSLTRAVAAGSYVAVCHQASDLDQAMPAVARRWNAMSDQRIKLRSRAELTELLTGLEPVPPGLVPVMDWRPAVGDPCFDVAVPIYGVVARKP